MQIYIKSARFYTDKIKNKAATLFSAPPAY